MGTWLSKTRTRVVAQAGSSSVTTGNCCFTFDNQLDIVYSLSVWTTPQACAKDNIDAPVAFFVLAYLG